MEYELMIPPIDAKLPFKEFSKAQAKEYFQWHISQIDHRIQVLDQYIREEGWKIEFDYSPESLISLWDWYEGHIVVEKKTQNEHHQEILQHPEWMSEYISTSKVSMMETMKFGADVAIYFAEVICKNSDGKVKWGYYTKPKKMASVNRPVLLGFKANMDMDPDRIIYTCTLRSVEEREKTRLFDMYNVWQQYIV